MKDQKSKAHTPVELLYLLGRSLVIYSPLKDCLISLLLLLLILLLLLLRRPPLPLLHPQSGPSRHRLTRIKSKVKLARRSSLRELEFDIKYMAAGCDRMSE